jgi:hypothetical protein
MLKTQSFFFLLLVTTAFVILQSKFGVATNREPSNHPSLTSKSSSEFLQRVQRIAEVPSNDRMLVSVCANGGRFLRSFCISDYNCERSPVAGSRHSTICIRGRCCTKTGITRGQANVHRPEDEVCSNGGFFMDKHCMQLEDCNVEDAVFRSRPFPLQVCILNSCCSTVYIRPTRAGQRCLNGGHFMGGRDCVDDVDCSSVGGVCVEQSCCSGGHFYEGSPLPPPSPYPTDNLLELYGDDPITMVGEDEESLRRRGRNVCAHFGVFAGRRCKKVSK